MNSEIAELFAQINASGGLPIQMVAQTEWTQFAISVIIAMIGSFFILFFMWSSIQNVIASVMATFKLARVQKILGRNILLIKHTQMGLFGGSMITTNTMLKIEKALNKFEGEPFDLIIHSPGGEVFSSQLLAKILHEYKGNIRAVIPYYAMSGGSLLALSCDEILMSDISCMGAVDPQIGSIFSYGSTSAWNNVVKKKGRKADDASYMMAYMGNQCTESIRMTLNEILKDKITDPEKLIQTINYLTNGKIDHARQLSRSDLGGLGIVTLPLDIKVKGLLAEIFTNHIYEGVYFFKKKK